MPNTNSSSEGRPFWFAEKQVQVLTFRINRRPTPQGNLFAEQPERFIDHLVECLQFGLEITTTGRGHERHWRLGNRNTGEHERWVSGWIGFRAENAEERDEYDLDTSAWLTEVVDTEISSTAPFVIVSDTRYLCIAKHPKFSEGVLPVVFETLLNLGERAREQVTTIWAVEPVLDIVDFELWLQDMAVVDQVTFTVKRPNPDADEDFEQLEEHLRATEAGTLIHTLKPSDRDRGLTKNFNLDSISHGLMQMARLSFAAIKATGRNREGIPKYYDQGRRVRHQKVRMPATPSEATRRLIEYATEQELERGRSG